MRFSAISASLVLILLVATATIEWLNGRVLMCKCGYIKLWHGVVQSSENSQHIADWYSFSHIIHGFIFFGITSLVLRPAPISTRLALATLVECTWEVFENSSFIINRYRSATIALDYFGDSIVNSMSDIAFMMLGFALAAKIPWRMTLGAAVAMEIMTLVVIRDNLTLNVLMLLYPIEAIKLWQGGA